VSLLLTVVALVWLAEQVVPLLQGFGDILLLFFLAWLVAFVLEPLVSIQERLRIPRTVAVALVFGVLLLGLIMLVVLIGPLVVEQLGQLRDSLPTLLAQLPPEEQVTQFVTRLGLPVRELSAIYRPEALAQQLQASAGDLLQRALALATSALNLVVNVVLLLIISFYMLLDGRRIIWSVLRIVPADYRDNVMVFLDQVSASFGGFLRGQVIQAVIFGLVVAAVMLALGLEFVAVSALTSALLMLIPIVGPLLAVAPPLGVALFHTEGIVISVLVVLVPVQFAVVNVLMPRILSHQIGMPPLLVFLSILLGLRIGGPLGAFFGIPIMGVIHGTLTVLYGRWRNGDDGRHPQAESPAEQVTRTNST